MSGRNPRFRERMNQLFYGDGGKYQKSLARTAYQLADAMLEMREK